MLFFAQKGGAAVDYRTRLRHVREDKDLTQAQIGKILNKSQQGYNHIESGRAELKIDDLIRLCRYYDLSADYLIGLSDETKSYK
ncbi:MAG: helix-turn-helix transcriptional regulator [Ruminococcaceae bacterium]|nr:helix-turn-helix transcriptional regulator [Oscillospiraceae bacterium]